MRILFLYFGRKIQKKKKFQVIFRLFFYKKNLRGCLNFIQNDVFLLIVSQSRKVRKDFNMDNPALRLRGVIHVCLLSEAFYEI